MKISILFVILFSVANCKVSDKRIGKNPNSNIQDIIFPVERALLKSEIEIGRNICSALKKKRETFFALENKKEVMKFHGTVTTCQGSITLDSPFDTTINTTPVLEYIAINPRENYLKEIITDKSNKVLDELCSSLAATDNVSNTVNLQDARYTAVFWNDEGYDHYRVRKELNNGKGSYTWVWVEAIAVITLANQAAEKYMGVEKERIRLTNCGANKSQSIKQNWVVPSIVTD